jgi:hypothetical protein
VKNLLVMKYSLDDELKREDIDDAEGRQAFSQVHESEWRRPSNLEEGMVTMLPSSL